MIQQQIDEITEGIEQMKDENGDRFTIKNMEKTRKNLEACLTRLIDAPQRDDVVTLTNLSERTKAIHNRMVDAWLVPSKRARE